MAISEFLNFIGIILFHMQRDAKRKFPYEYWDSVELISSTDEKRD